MSEERQDDGPAPQPGGASGHADLCPMLRDPGPSSGSYGPYRSFLAEYSQPTPFPSQADGPWPHPSFASSWSGYPSSLPSYLTDKHGSGCSGESYSSLPGGHGFSVGGSLEQPLSLRSNPPSADLCRHTLSPYSCSPQGASCWAQRPADTFSRGHVANKHPWARPRPSLHPNCE